MEDEATIETQEQPLLICVALKDYLAQLHGIEASKPPSERRAVPTLTQLAKMAGIHRVTLTNLANNKIKLVNLSTLSALLNALRRCGFECTIPDLLRAYPASEVA